MLLAKRAPTLFDNIALLKVALGVALDRKLKKEELISSIAE